MIVIDDLYKGALTQHLIVVTHKGRRNFKVEVHYGKRGMDVDCWDLESTCMPGSLEDFGPIQQDILRKICKRFNSQGPLEFCLQLTDDLSGPSSTPRQRVYKMWFFDNKLGVELGGDPETAPDLQCVPHRVI